MRIKINSLIKSASLLIALLAANACVDPEDLITDGALEGGLLWPSNSNMSFVGNPVDFGATTSEGITDVTFYKTYTKGGVTSDEVEDRTVAVTGDGVEFTADYAALSEGLAGMPADPAELVVGDYWTYRLVSTMEDGRKVASGSKIKVTVDNPYSGKYASSGTRWNFNSAGDANISTMPPTGFVSAATWAFDTDVTTVDATTCSVQCGNLNGDFGTMNIKVNPDNTVEVISTDDTGLANLVPLPGYTSTYDPATKTFTLYYQYTNDTGTHRVLRHYLVRK